MTIARPALVVLASGCFGSSPPHRDSPRLVPAEVFPADTSLAGIDADRNAWAYDDAAHFSSNVLVCDEAGMIATVSSGSWFEFDVASDRSGASCNDRGVRLFDGTTSSDASWQSLTGDERAECGAIAAKPGLEVWLLVMPDRFSAMPGSAPQLCHANGGAWTCSTVPNVSTYSLAFTEQHLWWIADGNLFATELQAPANQTIVLQGVAGLLQPVPGTESVLVSQADSPTRLITLSGTATDIALGSEGDPKDIWITRDGRMLGVNAIIQPGTTRCVPAGGCSTPTDWTQLIVYDLDASPPRELGHIDFDDGATVFGSEARVAGDRWYALP